MSIYIQHLPHHRHFLVTYKYILLLAGVNFRDQSCMHTQFNLIVHIFFITSYVTAVDMCAELVVFILFLAADLIYYVIDINKL